jgi:hypothetical protein
MLAVLGLSKPQKYHAGQEYDGTMGCRGNNKERRVIARLTEGTRTCMMPAPKPASSPPGA